MGLTHDSLLKDRKATHGNWEDQAFVHDKLLDVAINSQNWSSLTPSQRMAINVILMKISRICTGDPNNVDHWRDICGYSLLEEKQLNDT